MSVSSSTLPVPEYIYCYNEEHDSISIASSDSLLEEDNCDVNELQENSNASSDNGFDNCDHDKMEKRFDNNSKTRRPCVKNFLYRDCSASTTRNRSRLSSFPPQVEDDVQRHHQVIPPHHRYPYRHKLQNNLHFDCNKYGRLSSTTTTRKYNPYLPAKLQNCNNECSSPRQGDHCRNSPIPRKPWRHSHQ